MGTGRLPHRLAVTLACATFLLLAVGSLVTSLRAGDSIPDWPGPWFPEGVRGALVEYGHRIAAAVVGFLTLATLVALWIAEPRRWVRMLGALAFVGVLAQALLGGLRIHVGDRPEITVTHAGVAEAFFCLTVALAMVTSRRWVERSPAPLDARLPAFAAAVTFVQILFGAYLRHTGGGLAFHLAGAAAALAAVGWTANRAWDAPPLRPLGGTAISLVIAQVALGLVLWFLVDGSTKAQLLPPSYVIFATLHLLFGALILVHCVLLSLRASSPGTRYPVLGASL